MTDTLTRSQVDWAASHDWYNSRREDGAGGYIVTVRDIYWVDNHNTATRFLDFTNIHQLRHWAGY